MSSEIVDTGAMQTERDVERGNGYKDDSLCHRFCEGPGPRFSRYIYALMFLVANISAWLARENHIIFFEGQRLKGCLGDRDCLATDVVMILSLTSFLFFFVMFCSTVNTRKLHDHRNMWHSQWWIAKGILLAGCLTVSTMVPSYLMQLYGKAAHFGAGYLTVYLLIQLLSVIRWITRRNYKWCQINFENRYLRVIVVSIIAYSCSTVVIILMSLWYTACWLNIAFIGTTLLAVYVMPLIALKSKANGFYMEPALMGFYIVYLCYSSIKSEPETFCYKKEKASSSADWKIITSFVIELIGTTVAAFSTGTDYKCIQLRNVAKLEDDVPYGYGFFHFVFAMGSMYFGMLFVGWDTHHIREERLWSVDVSWTSTWIHIVNEGLAVLSFVAILVSRIYGIGVLQQVLARIFGTSGQQQQYEMANDEEGVGGPPPSPQTTTTDKEEEMLSIDSIDTGPPPSPQHQPTTMQQTTTTINQERFETGSP